jgi:Fe-Mn family superoxide dismutase
MLELPALPYSLEALSPHLSAETLEYHYGKHHRAYVNNLNQMVPGTEYERMNLEGIIRSSSGKIFNNAAQVWNHTFYWNSLARNGDGMPKRKPGELIAAGFGSSEEFQKQFAACALGASARAGPGW